MSRFREQFGDRRVELASPDHSGCLDGPESLEPRPETASRSDVRFRIVATSSMSPVSVPQASPASATPYLVTPQGRQMAPSRSLEGPRQDLSGKKRIARHR